MESSFSDAWYVAKINHADETCQYGDGWYDKAERRPCQWYRAAVNAHIARNDLQQAAPAELGQVQLLQFMPTAPVALSEPASARPAATAVVAAAEASNKRVSGATAAADAVVPAPGRATEEQSTHRIGGERGASATDEATHGDRDGTPTVPAIAEAVSDLTAGASAGPNGPRVHTAFLAAAAAGDDGASTAARGGHAAPNGMPTVALSTGLVAGAAIAAVLAIAGAASRVRRRMAVHGSDDSDGVGVGGLQQGLLASSSSGGDGGGAAAGDCVV